MQSDQNQKFGSFPLCAVKNCSMIRKFTRIDGKRDKNVARICNFRNQNNFMHQKSSKFPA